ncbi:MAG: hypothetical protein ACRDRL_27595 [Sciscionella sp.]
MSEGLKTAFEQFRCLLEPFAVEVGGEVLFVWVDRDRHGYEVLPPVALRALADWTEKQLADEL